MNQAIICNLVSGKIGRSALFNRRPTFYLGQSSDVTVYFEGLPPARSVGDHVDGYASSANVDRSEKECTILIGERGQAPITTTVTDTALEQSIDVTQAFSNGKLVFSFFPTPVSGNFAIEATISSLVNPVSPAHSHSDEARTTETVTIFADAVEADIEDAIVAMIHEKIIMDLDIGVAASIAPTVRAQALGVNEYEVFVAIPDIVYTKPDDGTVFLRTFTVDALAVKNSGGGVASLKGPFGKFGALAFTDAAFATLLGTENEKALWMEIMLDSQTVAAGEILLRKPMP